jgi:hypothetical protein
MSAAPAWSADRHGLRIALRRRAAAVPARIDAAGIDAACVLVVVVAVLINGIVVLLGLPHRFELVGDAAAAALLVLAAVCVIRAGSPIRLPHLAIAFAVLLVIAAARSDDFLRLVVSARNFVLLPALALALAALGSSERRNRAVLLTVVGLMVVEFGVTIVQALTLSDVDLVVGTFGDYNGPQAAFALVAGGCLAFGVYAAGAGRLWWLALGAALPLFSIWAAIRIVPLVVPCAAGAVTVAAWWAWRGAPERRWRVRRPVVIGAAAVFAAAVLLAGYAIARPSDFQLLTNSQVRQSYLQSSQFYAGAKHKHKATHEHKTTHKNNATHKPGHRANGKRKPRSRQVPGRLTQYKAAENLIERSPASFLFGAGLGKTTYAVNLGVHKPAERGAQLAGYSDFGTLLVELGWLGIAVTAGCAVGLGLGCLAGARRAPPGSWTRALLIGYPGVLTAMAALSFEGAPFRNEGSATIFWVLTGLVLASILEPRARPRDAGS